MKSLFIIMAVIMTSFVNGQGVPSWANHAAGEWVALGNGTKISTAMGSHVSQGIYAYSGGALDEENNLYYMTGGGHADYWGNEVYSIDLNAENPTWVERSQPTASADIGYGSSDLGGAQRGYAYDAQGRPVSRHTWEGTVQWLPNLGSQGWLMFMAVPAAWGNGNGSYNTLDAWDPALASDPVKRGYTWVNPSPNVSSSVIGFNNGPNPNFQAFPGAMISGCVKDKRGDVWAIQNPNGAWYKWTSASRTWSSAIRTVNRNGYPIVYDSFRDRVVAFPDNVGTPGHTISCTSPYNYATWSWGSAPPVTAGTAWYEPDIDRYVFLPKGSTTLYQIHPTTWTATAYSMSGSPPTLGQQDGFQSHQTRFQYIPALKGCILFHMYNEVAHFVRTSGGTGVQAGGQPVAGLLRRTYPNPFHLAVAIEYRVERKGWVDIGVYDLKGELVKRITKSEMAPGLHQAAWDGIDRNGRKAAIGFYVCKIGTGDRVEQKKLALIR